MKSPGSPPNPELARRGLDISGGPRRRLAEDVTSSATKPADMPDRTIGERRLIVGREISLAGEINACDHLVVEGRIEAKLKECRIIEVADSGVFKGAAEIEEADIAGQFDGDLSVRGKLRVRGTGTISGNIRYGRIEVEAGGRLIGTVQPLDDKAVAADLKTAEAETAPSLTMAASGVSNSAAGTAGLTSSITPAATGGVVHALSDGAERSRGESAD